MTTLKGTRFISLALLLTVIFALILLTPGCGAGRDTISAKQLAEIQKQREKKKAKEEAEREKKEAEKKKERETRKREAEKKKAEARARQLRLQNKNRTTPHPTLAKDWTDKDFYIAKVEQDKRLFEAVEYLATSCEDSQRAVRLLGELITPDTPLTKEELDLVGVRSSYRYDRQVNLLAQALVTCDTQQSIELVKQIISREVATDAPGVAIPATLQALATYPTERNEPVFLDALRKQHEGVDKLLPTIIDQGASESFRSTLAEYSMVSTCPESKRQAIWNLLCKNDPRNLPAMLLLYREDQLPGSYRKSLERLFAGLAQSAVKHVCGFPLEEKSKASKQRRDLSRQRQAQTRRSSGFQGQFVARSTDQIGEAELIKQVQNNLWNDQFASLLAKRLYQVDSLEEDNQLILLAMNTPRDETRKMLGDLLLRNWQETPAKLKSIGFPENVVVEPGFWLVAKRVLNESETSAEKVVNKGQRTRGRAGREEETVDPVQLAWKQAFGKMLIAVCERLEAAGRPVYSQEEITGVSTSAAGESESSSDTISMTSLLHTKARPVTECKLQMPNDSLVLHYIRCEELARPEVILKQYRGKLDGASELSGPTLCWLGKLIEEEPSDTATEGEAKRFQSADVLLRIEQNGATEINPSEKLEISVEILLISSK